MISSIKELYENGDETLQRDAGYIMTAMAAEVDLTGDYTESFLENFVDGQMPNLMSKQLNQSKTVCLSLTCLRAFTLVFVFVPVNQSRTTHYSQTQTLVILHTDMY